MDETKLPARRRPRDPTLYRVIVADNYHYQDDDEEYVGGDFSNEADAVAYCQRIVERSLLEVLEPGITADAMLAAYRSFGEDPYVLAPKGTSSRLIFSAWDYAKVRSAELSTALSDSESGRPGTAGPGVQAQKA